MERNQRKEAFFDTSIRGSGGMVICGEEASYYDEHQYCRCEEGQSMSYIESEHDDDHEDRTWKFKCQLIPGTKKDTPIETRDSSRDASLETKQSGYSDFLSDQMFDVQSVPLLQNAGENCWDECTDNEKGEGRCNWCGLEGYCCYKGYSGNGCDGSIGGNGYHACVTYPASGLRNGGEDCWWNCNGQSGECSWCGSKGLCCRKDWPYGQSRGCDGSIGGNGYHTCVLGPGAFNGFIVGMESYHHDNHGANGQYKMEDRRFRFFWQESPSHTLSDDCSWTGWLNKFDEKVQYQLSAEEVIAGVQSTYSRSTRDRRFKIKTCSLVGKCGVIGTDPIYDLDNMDYTTEDVTAGELDYDNLIHSEAGTWKVAFSETLTDTLVNSYSFQRESGNEMTASAEVSAGVSWGIGLAEANVAVTAGFSSTWKTTETWSRQNSHTATKVNGQTIEFQATCPAQRYCTGKILMKTGTANIPYKIISHTKGNPDEECTETGTLKVKRSWSAYIKVESYKKCECNPEGTVNETDCDQENGMCICREGWSRYDCSLPPTYPPSPCVPGPCL